MTLLLIAALVAQPAAPMSCGTPVFHEMALGLDAPARATTPRPAEPPRRGDTLTLWTWNMSVMPPIQFQADFVVYDVGPHCYVMVHDSVLAAGLVDSADAARIVERFDHSSPRDSTRGVWDHNTGVLGMPPDEIDQDSAIYLIYYNIGTFMGSSFDGFWMAFDEYYDTTSMRMYGCHSNEIECVYLDCHPNNPSSDYRVAIAAHEMGHMIHWNYDQAESLWVQEGCCELAMWLFGAPDPISGFPSNPDNDLTRWDGNWSDYIKTYLFFLHLYEQYGGRVGTDLIHNIIASPARSIAGVDEGFASTGLAERFEDVLDQWVLANRINDTSFLGGRYGYHGENVPRFAVQGYHYTYPVDRNGSLSRWAGEYLLFQEGTDLSLTFDGADAADFRLYVVGLDTIGHQLLLDSIALDSVQYGEYSLTGHEYQSVYLVPVSHYPYGAQGYRYTASATGIEERDEGGRMRAESRLPSVVRNSLVIPESPMPKCQYLMTLLDATGREVMQLQAGANDVSAIAPGVYFVKDEGARLKDEPGTRTAVHRVVMAR